MSDDSNISSTLDIRRQFRDLDPATHVVIAHPGPRFEVVTRDEAIQRMLASTPGANAEELGWNLEPLTGQVTVAEQSGDGWTIRHLRSDEVTP